MIIDLTDVDDIRPLNEYGSQGDKGLEDDDEVEQEGGIWDGPPKDGLTTFVSG